MSDVAKNGGFKKWGVASTRFVKLPFELLVHYRALNISEEELLLIMWLDFHQWGERATFIHPAKTALALNKTEGEIVSKLKELKSRGFITLERTKSNARNYHQDTAPLRFKLRSYLTQNPEHCIWYQKNDLQRIDVSINSNDEELIDTSILDKRFKSKASSMKDIINLKSKKE